MHPYTIPIPPPSFFPPKRSIDTPSASCPNPSHPIAISNHTTPFSPSSLPTPFTFPRCIRLHSSWSAAASTSLAVMLAASSSISSARTRLRMMARKAVTVSGVSLRRGKGVGGVLWKFVVRDCIGYVPAKPVSSTKMMALKKPCLA